MTILLILVFVIFGFQHGPHSPPSRSRPMSPTGDLPVLAAHSGGSLIYVTYATIVRMEPAASYIAGGGAITRLRRFPGP